MNYKILVEEMDQLAVKTLSKPGKKMKSQVSKIKKSSITINKKLK